MSNVLPAQKNILLIFGKRVKFLRKQKKLSQEELAYRTGLHRTYIGAVERGERNISLKNIAKLAEAFGINIAELFQEQDQ